MIKIFLVALALISLLTDTIIFRQLARRFPDRSWLRKTYLAVFITISIMAVSAVILMRSSLGGGSVLPALWLMWTFIAFTVSKIVYLTISWPDYFTRLKNPGRKRIFSTAGSLAAVAVCLQMSLGATIGRNTLRIENVEIASEKIKESFDGYTVAFISDLHLGNFSASNDLIEELVAEINSLDPDAVIVGGDIVNSKADELSERYMNILSGIQSRDGVFAVPGNHDLGLYIFDGSITPEQNILTLKDKINAIGWKWLENKHVYVTKDADSIVLSGVGYPKHMQHNGMENSVVPSTCDIDSACETISPDIFTVLASHTPEIWDEILEKKAADLMISGHVHAMQMKINLFGKSWSPAALKFDRWSGLYREQGRDLYINDGIGYVMYPMRIGARPEITVFTLRSL